MTPEFDFEKAAVEAQRGIDLAYNNAIAKWRWQAHEAIVRVADRADEFTVDEVWQELRASGIEFEPKEPRAMGGVVQMAAKMGYIEKVGYRPSSRVSCHKNPTTVWRRKR